MEKVRRRCISAALLSTYRRRSLGIQSRSLPLRALSSALLWLFFILFLLCSFFIRLMDSRTASSRVDIALCTSGFIYRHVGCSKCPLSLWRKHAKTRAARSPRLTQLFHLLSQNRTTFGSFLKTPSSDPESCSSGVPPWLTIRDAFKACKLTSAEPLNPWKLQWIQTFYGCSQISGFTVVSSSSS